MGEAGDEALKSRLAEGRRYWGPSRLGVDRDLEARTMLNLAAGRDKAVGRDQAVARASKLLHASRCRDTRVMGYPRQHPRPRPTPDAPPAAAAGRIPADGKACTSMSAKERAREHARERGRETGGQLMPCWTQNGYDLKQHLQYIKLPRHSRNRHTRSCGLLSNLSSKKALTCIFWCAILSAIWFAICAPNCLA